MSCLCSLLQSGSSGHQGAVVVIDMDKTVAWAKTWGALYQALIDVRLVLINNCQKLARRAAP